MSKTYYNRNKMKTNICALCQVFGFYVTGVVGWTCLFPIGKTYCETGTTCAIRFNISTYLQSHATYSIAFYNGKPYGAVAYIGGQIAMDQLPGTNLTADETGNIELTFFSVNSSKAGTYKIDLISNTVPCVTLYILDKPAAPIVSKDSVPVEGGNVTLTCTSNSTTVPCNHSLTMSYNWRVGDLNNPVNSRFKYTQSNKNLIVSDISKEDSHVTFSCRATESVSGLSSSWSIAAYFEVIYGPDAVKINISNNYKVIEGEVVDNIWCFCDCFPTCIYDWLYENYSLTSGALLSLGIADRNKAGRYTCSCRNNGTRKSKYSSFELYVEYAPEVSIRVSRSTVSHGVPVALFCEATGIPSMYNYQRFQQSFNGKVINREYNSVAGTQENSSLFLLSPQLQDTGTYTCFASNGIGKNGFLFQTGSIRIEVAGTPLFLTNKTHLYGTPGEDLVIVLPFYSHPELTNVTFIREDGLVISSSNTYNISITNSSTAITTKFYTTDVSLNASIINMTILNVSAEHFGQYSVNIFNSFGESAIIFTAEATGPPLPPTDLTAYTSSEVLFLTWKRSSNRGSEQTFLVQTSTDGERWTNQTNIQESDHRHLLSASSERYFAILTALQAGTYRCRLITWNELGYAETVYWQNPSRVYEVYGECGMPFRNDTSLVIGVVLGTSNLLCLIVTTFLAKSHIKRSHATNKKGGSSAKCIENTCSRSATTTYANISYKDSDMSSSTAPYSSLEDHLRSEPGAYDVITSTNAALYQKT